MALTYVHSLVASCKTRGKADEDQCTSCQACDSNIDSTDFTSPRSSTLPATIPSTVFKNKRGAIKKSPQPKCIIICTHAYCDLLCISPRVASSPFAETNTVNNNNVTANTANALNTTALLASVNMQPDKIGIPLAPGTNMVVLGQKEIDGRFKKCVWFCNSATVLCQEKCWDLNEAESAAVANGGYIEDKAVEGSVKCDVVEKNDVGRLLVCRPPAAIKARGDDVEDGREYKVMHKMRCTLFWRGRMPHLVCREL